MITQYFFPDDQVQCVTTQSGNSNGLFFFFLLLLGLTGVIVYCLTSDEENIIPAPGGYSISVGEIIYPRL
jgi:hypothetical protein